MRKLLLTSVLLFSLHAQMIDGVSVVVEDKIITLYDIQKEMQLSHVSKKQAIDILIRKKLEALEVKKRGIRVTQDEVFDEIRRLAEANHMSLSEFYDLVRKQNGLTSQELQEKIKERLLSQKLYQAIAFSKMGEPDMAEVKQYYELHKQEFTKPAFIDVVIYSAQDKTLLEQKRQNPLFFSQAIQQQSQRINTDRINPQLLEILLKTNEGEFSPIIPNGQGGFITFYIQQKGAVEETPFEQLVPQIKNAIMAQKRAEILDDYFAKLKDSADIKIIRE